AGEAFRFEGEAAEVAEEDGDVGFSGCEYDVGISSANVLQHWWREKLSERSLLSRQALHVAEAAERGGRELGEFHFVLQMLRIAERFVAELSGQVNAPFAAWLARERHAHGPVDAQFDSERRRLRRCWRPDVDHARFLRECLPNEPFAR